MTTALRELDPGSLDDHPLARAEAAGVVQLGKAHVTFVHPTLRSAAYHLAAPADRRRAHGAVARATSDEIVRAWHAGQACIGPDDEVADALASAAGELLRRRAPAAAADHWERAAALTTDPQRAARWLRLGVDALSQTGRADAALALLHRADSTAGEAGDPIEQVLRQRARLRLAARTRQPAEIAVGLRDLASTAEDLDPRLSAEIHLDCVPALLGAFRMGEIESAAKAALAQAGQAGAGDIERRAQMVLGGVRLTRGELEGQALLDLYLDVLDHEGAVNAAPFLAEVAAPFLGVLRRGPEVDALFDVLDRDLRAAVAIPALVTVLGARAILNHGRDLRRTIADDVEAIELADAIERPDLARFATGSLAVAAALRGDAERTAWAAERCALSSEPAHHVAGLAGPALLHLGRGELDDALALYETLYERHGIAGSIVRWEPDWCEALIRARRPERAREMLDEFAGSPMGLLATGGVARARGMLAEDEDAAVEQFEQAFAFLDVIPNAIVRGRTELVWGERLRRSRKRAEARVHLARAEELLRGVGADLWADRAARELVAAGAATADRNGTIGALTGQEREAAQLAIAGASNREIADRMFLSPRTVETHLSGAYRKLGVSNRRELLIWASEGGTLDA